MVLLGQSVGTLIGVTGAWWSRPPSAPCSSRTSAADPSLASPLNEGTSAGEGKSEGGGPEPEEKAVDGAAAP
ncbi:hypothetical protein GCM10010387_22730 [Streptomyces inusitatus]|uniref:Uncharacterized protein n=1 Tax=Streptomyces inusitatus TaxID=68221 RepID=A0A918Q259_9ACTN|nr:hypothetical protein GCM10010387_22730 [Streptomyces inusitatus]